MSNFIPVYEPDMSGNELEYVTECIKTGWISSRGKFVPQFEEEFAKYVGTKHAVAASNGTTALHLVLAALGLGKGDEILVPDFTYVATVNAVTYTGATPVLIDADRETWNIDPGKLEEKLTKNTRAILPVHIYGQPADMDPIMALAKKHSLTVIEDAAQAHGALYNDRQVGSIGDAGAFSFFGNKIITTGEGGMITTDDAELAHKARLLRNHGMSETRTYWHDHLGFNYRMTNLQAAIGVAQLERIDEILKTKIALAQRYKNLLKDVPGVIQPPDVPGIKNVYWMYSIRLDEKFGMTAEALQKVLRENEIDSRPFFIPVHELPMYEEKGAYPVSTELSKTGLSLPSSPKLTHEDIDRITSVVRKATG